MANPGRPRIARAPSDPTFYQVRKPASGNSDSDALGLNTRLFLIGCFSAALAILFLRNRDTVQGVVVGQDAISPVEQIPNITQRLIQQADGSYDPSGSSMHYPTYPGLVN